MKWHCSNCNEETEHDYQYIDEDNRPKSYLSAMLTCSVCRTVDWGTDEIFDSHTCNGSGDWCYCNDTMHKHCDHCDSICNTDPTYQP